MNNSDASSQTGRRQALAVGAYVSGLAVIIAASLSIAGGLIVRSREVDALHDSLAMLEAYTSPSAAQAARIQPPGSPLLEGQTLTVAGAALQQRISDAVVKAGGTLQSSQIELNGPQARDGFVSLTANLDIANRALQPLLYDIEAGMPYIFVESLAIQSPQAFGEAEGAPMRVTLSVSGQWRPSP
jgi:general secretion pathway protein M